MTIESIQAILMVLPVGTHNNWAQPVEKHGDEDFSGYGLSHVSSFDMATAIQADIDEEVPQDFSFFITKGNSNPITNTTAATNFSRKVELPVNFFNLPKKTVHVTGSFKYSTASGSQDFTPFLRLGGANVVNYGARAMGDGVSNRQLYLSCRLVCESVGASGVLRINHEIIRVNGNTFGRVMDTATVDTTAQLTLRFRGQWANASTSNTIVLEEMMVRVLG